LTLNNIVTLKSGLEVT